MPHKNGKKFAKRVGRAVRSTARDAQKTGLRGTFKKTRLKLKPSTRRRIGLAKSRFMKTQDFASKVNRNITAAYS